MTFDDFKAHRAPWRRSKAARMFDSDEQPNIVDFTALAAGIRPIARNCAGLRLARSPGGCALIVT